MNLLLLFLGAVMTAAIRGTAGKMPTFNIPTGRGWRGLREASRLQIPADIGIGVILATLPWTRPIGLGVLFYTMVSFTAYLTKTLRDAHEEKAKAAHQARLLKDMQEALHR